MRVLLYRYKEEDEWGMIDSKGKVIIEKNSMRMILILIIMIITWEDIQWWICRKQRGRFFLSPVSSI